MQKQYKSPELKTFGRIEKLTLGTGVAFPDFLAGELIRIITL